MFVTRIFNAKQYNSMKLQGNEEWNKFNMTTSESILSDWFHSPSLSNWAKKFYQGRGDMIKLRDVDGKNKVYHQYGGERSPNAEVIRSTRCLP